MLILKSQSTYYKKRKIFNPFAIFEISKMYLVAILAIFSIGLLCLFSANNGNLHPIVTKQLIFFLALLPSFLIIISINIKYIASYFSYLIYLMAIGLLIMVLICGRKIMGAVRWIDLGFFSIQPSEISKIAVILILSRYFSKISNDSIGNIKHTVYSFLLISPIMALIVIQPDLATTIIICFIFIAMVFLSGANIMQFVLGFLSILLISPFIWQHLKEYQKLRIINFLNPENDPLNSGYNIIQSKIAIGSGGLFGAGFLQGTQGQLNFLPEHHTDFIFTIIGEEFGFVGAMIVLGLYLYIIYFGIFTSLKTINKFGKFVAMGCSSLLFVHLFVNVGMTIAILPVAGIPLPFLSYGGSILMTSILALALIANVYINADIE